MTVYPPTTIPRLGRPDPGLDDPRRLDPYSADHHEERGCERDEYPSHVDSEIRRLVRAGTTTTRNGPGSLRTEHEVVRATDVSRLRRRAPAIAGSADRSPRERGTARRSRECGIAE